MSHPGVPDLRFYDEELAFHLRGRREEIGRDYLEHIFSDNDSVDREDGLDSGKSDDEEAFWSSPSLRALSSWIDIKCEYSFG